MLKTAHVVTRRQRGRVVVRVVGVRDRRARVVLDQRLPRGNGLLLLFAAAPGAAPVAVVSRLVVRRRTVAGIAAARRRGRRGRRGGGRDRERLDPAVAHTFLHRLPPG
jgi:hypothetical protein